MSRERSLRATWWLLAALLAALFAACADDGGTNHGIYVQQTWQLARAVTGHRVHVLKQRIACSSCHELGESALGKVEPQRCATCHEKQVHIEHAQKEATQHFGKGTRADCTSCHAFTLEGSGHGPALTGPAEPSRSGTGGGRGEPPLIETFGPGDCKRCHSQRQGDIPAVAVHGTQDCLSCHRPHDDAMPKSAPCSECHRDISTKHASAGKTLVETCSTCHSHQHAAAIDARATCVDCHSRHEPLVPKTALFAGGHSECLGCHRPHAFGAEQAVDCRSCHRDQAVLGGGQVAAHQQCTNCHAPHDVKASPGLACAGCHPEVHSDHPERGQAGSCVSCHDPHPRGSHLRDEARSCTSCHQFVPSDHGSHAGVDCIKCHKPHHFLLELSQTTACADCHAQRLQQVASNPGHADCAECHRGLPHRPEALRAGCETCHAKQAGLIAGGHASGAGPALGASHAAGHSSCTSCHEPHSGAPSGACSNCHQKEQASAPPGHQLCTNCHEPHSATHEVKVCGDCHAAEAKSAHGKLGSDCTSCHRPHGPNGVANPPACTSCHEPQKLPGLHAETKHQSCSTCHAGHGDAKGLERQVCLSCHRDRTTHFPDAPRCANCHLFTATH